MDDLHVSEIITELEEEIARLKRGDFTKEEFQNLCHNLPETCKREDFERGCKEYQEKLFGKDTFFEDLCGCPDQDKQPCEHTFVEHVCGLQGYNPAIDEMCPACKEVLDKQK